MAKVKIQITHWLTGSVLFEHESDGNTLVNTIREADLRGADLRGADLRGANLREADLYEADLYGANLREADLRGADLREANLRGANLREADLYEADLYGADLYEANLRGANLYEANLYEANLRGADLREAKNADYAIALTRILPEGTIIGWKKLKGGLIAKIEIPKEAKRSHAFGRKCRCEYALVLEIWNGKKKVKEGYSSHDENFKYVVGETVKPNEPFSDDWMDECAFGIHFFITKEEAVNY